MSMEGLPRPIAQPLRAVRRRLRLQRALNACALMSVAGAGVAALVITLVKTGTLPASQMSQWLLIATAFPVAGLLVGALRRVGPLMPAQMLDRTHGLRSRLANAVEFANLSERTPFMDASIRDAERNAAGLNPAQAMPLRIPREFGTAAIIGVGIALLSMVEVPHRQPLAIASELEPLLLDDDSLDAFESSLEPVLADAETSDDVREVASALNQVLEDIADRRLDRTEALRRLQALENRLSEGRPLDAEALEDSLRELGRDLERSALTTEASEALRDADAERAADQMNQLAQQLQQDAPSQQELQRLRDALQRAARDRTERQLQENEREQERTRRLLRQDEQNKTKSQRQRRLFQRRQRQLERLQRDQQRLEEQRRQLQRLRREMQQAAENLNRQAQDRNQAAENMQRAAEELNRMARENMSQEQRRDLERQIRQLREAIRRMQQNGGQGQQGQGQNGQGQNGQGRQGRMQRFRLAAGGQQGQGGAVLRIPGQGQQGQGQQGQGQQGQGQGQQGQGQGQGQQGQGQGQQGQGQGQQGQGQGQQGQGQQGQAGGAGGQGQGQGQGQNGQGQTVLTLGQGGNGQNQAILEIPGMGGSQQGQGQGQGQQGPGAGTGSNPQMLDNPTGINGRHQNSRVDGQHSEGPTRSEVILSAADRGFVGRGYQDVYTQYEDHAEEVLERDEVPPGYRFYVRRYFQLIRPREGAPSSNASDNETP